MDRTPYCLAGSSHLPRRVHLHHWDGGSKQQLRCQMSCGNYLQCHSPPMMMQLLQICWRAAGRRDANAWRCLRTLHLIQQCRTTRNQEHCYLGKVERWCYGCGRFTYHVGGTFRTSFRIGQKFLRVNLQGELRLRTIRQNGWTRFRLCQNWTWQSTCWAVDTGRTLWCGKKACRWLHFGVLSFSVQFLVLQGYVVAAPTAMASSGILQALASAPNSHARKKTRGEAPAVSQSRGKGDLSHANVCKLLIAHDRDINQLHAAATLALKFLPDSALADTLLMATKTWQSQRKPGQAHEFGSCGTAVGTVLCQKLLEHGTAHHKQRDTALLQALDSLMANPIPEHVFREVARCSIRLSKKGDSAILEVRFHIALFWCLIYMWSVVTFWLWMVSCWVRDRLGLCSDTVLDCDPFLYFVCNNASDESFYGHLALLWCCDACFCLVLLICRRLTGYVMLNLSETFIVVVVHYWCLPDQDVVILLWLVLTLLKRLKL